jgi:hypothetical protein
MENYINELNIKDKKSKFFLKNIKVDCSSKLTSIFNKLNGLGKTSLAN